MDTLIRNDINFNVFQISELTGSRIKTTISWFPFKICWIQFTRTRMLQLGFCSNTTTYCYPVDTWLVPLKLQLRQNLRNTIEDKNIYLYLLVVQDVAIKFLCKANRTPLFWCVVFVLVFWCIWCSGVSARACRRWLRDSLIGAITPTLPKTRRPAGLQFQ